MLALAGEAEFSDLGARFIKVDHAGEHGAVCIRSGQIHMARFTVPSLLDDQRVEAVVLRHLDRQSSALRCVDPNGFAAISAIVEEERAHQPRSLVQAPASRSWSAVLTPVVSVATEAVIWMGMRL